MKKTTTELMKSLEDFGVKPHDLWVVRVGEDFLVGEIGPDDRVDNNHYKIRNPKRIIRLQRVTGPGLEIEMLISDYDFLADTKGQDNVIYICPTMRYRIGAQTDASIQNVLSHLVAHYESKIAVSALEAGLVLPPSAVKSPFKK